MKKWSKKKRVFLNHPSTNCLGAVAWDVNVHQQRDWSSLTITEEETISRKGIKKLPKTWGFNAEITINKDARSHFIHRKADLRALKNMQRELNEFIKVAEKAIADVEKGNAKS